MMVEATPVASFVMSEIKLLLELQMVTLDPPVHFPRIHDRAERNRCRQRGQEVARRFALAFGPFDDQPTLSEHASGLGSTHAVPGKARTQRTVGSCTPCDRAIARAGPAILNRRIGGNSARPPQGETCNRRCAGRPQSTLPPRRRQSEPISG